MTPGELFAEAERRGLLLGRLAQYSYVISGVTKTDHWEAHFHTSKGVWISGSGRSPQTAMQCALYPTPQKPLKKRVASLDDLD